MLPTSADVVIVGGGVMGASLAYHLALRGQKGVVLLERNELFGQGATGKCAGGIRHQFGTEINIRLSLASIGMLERFSSELNQDIGLRWPGYLFLLTGDEDVRAFEHNVALQHRLGVMTQWLSPAEIRERAPLLQLDDVLGGTFFRHDGLADPNSVVSGYARKARELGATLLTQVEVNGFYASEHHVQTVRTTAGDIQPGAVVNAAGPQAASIGNMLGLRLPIVPLRRQMLVTTPLPDVPQDFPFVID